MDSSASPQNDGWVCMDSSGKPKVMTQGRYVWIATPHFVRLAMTGGFFVIERTARTKQSILFFVILRFACKVKNLF